MYMLKSRFRRVCRVSSRLVQGEGEGEGWSSTQLSPARLQKQKRNLNPPPPSVRLVLPAIQIQIQIHGVGLLAHALHPAIDELLVLGGDAGALLLRHVELHCQGYYFVLEALRFRGVSTRHINHIVNQWGLNTPGVGGGGMGSGGS